MLSVTYKASRTWMIIKRSVRYTTLDVSQRGKWFVVCTVTYCNVCVFMHVWVCMKEGEGERASEHCTLLHGQWVWQRPAGVVCCHGNVRQAWKSSAVSPTGHVLNGPKEHMWTSIPLSLSLSRSCSFSLQYSSSLFAELSACSTLCQVIK